MPVRFVILLAALLSLLSAQANAAEIIRDYKVQAQLQYDGSVDVTEQITVVAEGVQIKRGIYRDFPTTYKDRFGNYVNVGFKVLHIARDGKEEPYHLDSRSNGIRIYIGDENYYLDDGQYTYTLQYRVDRVIGFFADYDEFYWNVTGNGWAFPIRNSSIHVELPHEARIKQSYAYTGAQGDHGKFWQKHENGNIFDASTTTTLNPNEGFTIAVAFQKGLIKEPTTFDKIVAFFLDNIGWMICAISLVLSFIYMCIMWFLYGRDLPQGTIIPRFDLLPGVSPDLLRYINKAKYDHKVYVCLLVDAAVNGFLKIEQDEDELRIIANRKSRKELSPSGYAVLTGELFSNLDILRIPLRRFLKKLNPLSGDLVSREALAALLQRNKTSHLSFLENTYRDHYFKTNHKFALGIAALAVAAAVAIMWTAPVPDDAVPTLIITLIAHYALWELFARPMIRYTRKGRELLDYAKGLKLYLSVAEEARLNALYPKTITPEIFETMLPFALALGVEQKWCKHFEELVAQGLATYQDGYDSWYRSNGIISIGNLGYALGSSFSDDIASASTPPGSSSGSGGGGSSGGGGGGGGGGGW